MTNLSQWFDLAEQKPWEIGVYELGYPDDDGNKYYSWFDGKNFNGGFLKKEMAIKYKDRPLFILRANKWRGLSTNPEVKKKTQNKRKTMYVVMNAATNNPTASFFSVDVARDYAETVNFPLQVKRIRFRTPE